MRTVYWQDDKVKMIDQRLLPGEEVIAEFATVPEVARSIREMYVRGAPAIGATAAYGMALAAHLSEAADAGDLLKDLRQAKETLDAARPTAVNLSWATRRLLNLAEQVARETPSERGSAGNLRETLLAEAEALADEDVRINRRMGFNGAAVVPDGANLLHHCNTGSLQQWTSAPPWALSTPARNRAKTSMSGWTRPGPASKAPVLPLGS